MSLTTHLHALPPASVVYTDMDHTLLGREGSVLADGDGAPTLAAVAALVDAHRAGLAVVAVSGRRVGMLSGDARLLGLDGAIAEAGGVRLSGDTEHVAWGACPRGLAPSPRATLAAAGALEVVLAVAPGRIRPYQPWDEERVGGFLLHGEVDAGRANAGLQGAGLGWAQLIDNGPTRGWDGVPRASAYHLVPRGIGKAEAVTADLAERGVSAERAVAVGDSLADLRMAEAVGTYVAVANGVPGRATHCFQAVGAHGAGVAEVLRAVLARNAAG